MTLHSPYTDPSLTSSKPTRNAKEANGLVASCPQAIGFLLVVIP